MSNKAIPVAKLEMKSYYEQSLDESKVDEKKSKRPFRPGYDHKIINDDFRRLTK